MPSDQQNQLSDVVDTKKKDLAIDSSAISGATQDIAGGPSMHDIVFGSSQQPQSQPVANPAKDMERLEESRTTPRNSRKLSVLIDGFSSESLQSMQKDLLQDRRDLEDNPPRLNASEQENADHAFALKSMRRERSEILRTLSQRRDETTQQELMDIAPEVDDLVKRATDMAKAGKEGKDQDRKSVV